MSTLITRILGRRATITIRPDGSAFGRFWDEAGVMPEDNPLALRSVYEQREGQTWGMLGFMVEDATNYRLGNNTLSYGDEMRLMNLHAGRHECRGDLTVANICVDCGSPVPEPTEMRG